MKPRKVVAPADPAVDHGRDALSDPHHVRLDGNARDAVVDVHVDIDQPRGDDLARRVDDLSPLAFRDAFGYTGHAPGRDPDVSSRIDALVRIDEPPADDERVELPRLGQQVGCRNRTGRD